MLEAMFEALKERYGDLQASPWEACGTAASASALAVMSLVALVDALSTQTWVPVLDSLNLVFHEAGHPLFGIFGWETLTILGGTLMQLIVPLLVLTAAWGRRQAAGAALAGCWFFQNFHNIARYMADAREQVLPLAGGGEHDWFNLFLRWGCLKSDTAIARDVHILGWLGMLGSAAWLLWRWARREALQP
jgi:hypothetical protein